VPLGHFTPRFRSVKYDECLEKHASTLHIADSRLLFIIGETLEHFLHYFAGGLRDSSCFWRLTF
jgi:hypothetical protein